MGWEENSPPLYCFEASRVRRLSSFYSFRSKRRLGYGRSVPSQRRDPYAPIHGHALRDLRPTPPPLASTSIIASVLVWTVVCSLSAAPSFFIAWANMAKQQALAMILGILLFIGLYTLADLYSRGSSLRMIRGCAEHPEGDIHHPIADGCRVSRRHGDRYLSGHCLSQLDFMALPAIPTTRMGCRLWLRDDVDDDPRSR